MADQRAAFGRPLVTNKRCFSTRPFPAEKIANGCFHECFLASKHIDAPKMEAARLRGPKQDISLLQGNEKGTDAVVQAHLERIDRDVAFEGV